MDISFQRWPGDEAALTADPRAQALLDRAEDLVADGRPEEALWPLVEATEAAPDLWLTHYRYAELLLALGGPGMRDALPAAERARELNPAIPSTHTLHGLSREARGDRAGARASHQRALELDPDHVGALNNLAALDLGRWRLARAARTAAHAFDLDPEHPATRMNLALVSLRMAVRLLAALAVSTIVLGTLTGLTTSTVVRASTGGLLVVACAWLAVTSWRAVPAASRGSSWQLMRPVLPVVLVVDALVSVAVALIAFAPHDVALWTARAMLFIVIQLVGLAVIAVFVLAWVRRLRGPRGRR